jgi:hypothetical protein
MIAKDGFYEFMEPLVGKEISIIFNGRNIIGTLERISVDKDYLILKCKDDRKAIVYLKYACAVREGPV